MSEPLSDFSDEPDEERPVIDVWHGGGLEITYPADEPLFDSDRQVTAFLDVNGRLHLYRGAGIIDVYRLDGIDRAAALDWLRNAIEADYNRELGRG